MSSNRYINPSGFPENLPAEQLVEDELKRVFAAAATKYGYTHLETTSVEYMDTLASKGDVTKEIYTIGRALSEGESSEEGQRGLHFDLTVPFARYVAQHQGVLTFPYRRYQIQKVWRGERPQKGRFREFYQADIDVVARENLSIAFDAEVAMVVSDILNSFSIGSVTIHINNRKFLNGLCTSFGITNYSDALQAIDKLDKIGEIGVREMLRELGVLDDVITKLLEHITTTVALDEVIAYLDTIPDSNEELLAGKEEIRELFILLAAQPSRENVQFVFNPKIARGLDYYTGTVYETTIDGFEKYGSICSGGRYADLAGRFTNQKLPGVGLSIGLTRLLSIIKAEQLKDFSLKSPVTVSVCLASEASLIASLQTASFLRQHDIATAVNYKHTVALGKQIEQAKEQGIRFALISEADGKFTLFDLHGGAKTIHDTIEHVLELVQA